VDPYSVYWDSGGYIGLRTKGGGGSARREDFPTTAAAVKHRQTLNSRIAIKTARH
jgi:hypothetical protein